jgi:hypothetical protein
MMVLCGGSGVYVTGISRRLDAIVTCSGCWQRVGVNGMGNIVDHEVEEESPLAPVYAEVVGGYVFARDRLRRVESSPDLTYYRPEIMASLIALTDPDEYKHVYGTVAHTHPCEVARLDGELCTLTQEEHHRLMYGMLTENKAMRAKIRQLEEGR